LGLLGGAEEDHSIFGGVKKEKETGPLLQAFLHRMRRGSESLGYTTLQKIQKRGGEPTETGGGESSSLKDYGTNSKRKVS